MRGDRLPDGDKIGVFGPDMRYLFRREDARDYWDGEASLVPLTTTSRLQAASMS